MTVSSDTVLTEHFHAFADWLTEDVAQRLYAARQDLADAAYDLPGDADEIGALRDRLMTIVRSLHETACVLRAHDATTMPARRIEELAARVEEDCRAAETLMARGLSLIARPGDAPVVTALRARRAVRGDGGFAGRRTTGRTALLGLA